MKDIDHILDSVERGLIVSFDRRLKQTTPNQEHTQEREASLEERVTRRI